MREGDNPGQVTTLFANHQGTAHHAVANGDSTLTTRRQRPFGGPRGTDPAWPGEQGFVGGTNDNSVGTINIGARPYDPALGRFITVDPILDTSDPQQANGYTYANNTPVTLSDPSGLYVDPGPSGGHRNAGPDPALQQLLVAPLHVEPTASSGPETSDLDWETVYDPETWVPPGTGRIMSKSAADREFRLIEKQIAARERAAAEQRAREAAAAAAADRPWYQKAGSWVVEHRGMLATGAAGALCLGAIAVCAAATTVAFMVRTQQRVQEDGWSRDTGVTIVGDALVTTATFGVAGAAKGAAKDLGLSLPHRLATGAATSAVPNFTSNLFRVPGDSRMKQVLLQ